MAFNAYKSSKENVGGGFGIRGFNLTKYPKIKIFNAKKEKEADYTLVFVPYKITSKQDPNCQRGATVGDTSYNLIYDVHNYVGVGKKTVVCPRNLGKACPICEAYEQAKKEFGFDSKEAKDLKPKKRAIYNVIDMNSKEKDVMIFDESTFFFEKDLITTAMSRGAKKGIDCIPFGELKEGYSVDFHVEMIKSSFGENPKYTAFNFDKMEDPMDKEVMDKAVDLGACIKIDTYDEIMAILQGNDEDESEEEAPPMKSKATKQSNDEEAEETGFQEKEADEDKDEEPVFKCLLSKGKFGQSYDYDSEKCENCEEGHKCRRASKEYKKSKE